MAAEIWDLYDAHAKKTGKTMTRGEEIPSGLYHLVVHIWPINSRGEFLIQRRAPFVQWKPGVWAGTGGSAVSGEDALTAARRELGEELGYHAGENELCLIARMRRASSFCHLYALHTDMPAEAFILQEEEVSAVRWCDKARLSRMVADNSFYNYGDAYFRQLFDYESARRMKAAQNANINHWG